MVLPAAKDVLFRVERAVLRPRWRIGGSQLKTAAARTIGKPFGEIPHAPFAEAVPIQTEIARAQPQQIFSAAERLIAVRKEKVILHRLRVWSGGDRAKKTEHWDNAVHDAASVTEIRGASKGSTPPSGCPRGPPFPTSQFR